MPRDEHYSIALSELLEKRADQGLFARCFALEKGDEARTKAKYIELRAAAIEAVEIAMERNAQLAKMQELRLQKIENERRARIDESLKKRKRDELKRQRVEEARIHEVEAKRRIVEEKRIQQEEKKRRIEETRKSVAQAIEAVAQEDTANQCERSRIDPLSYEAFAADFSRTNSLWGRGIFERRRLYLEWRAQKE